eukprot:114976-Pelagomonas_calceolata.AAC.2
MRCWNLSAFSQKPTAQTGNTMIVVLSHVGFEVLHGNTLRFSVNHATKGNATPQNVLTELLFILLHSAGLAAAYRARQGPDQLLPGVTSRTSSPGTKPGIIEK